MNRKWSSKNVKNVVAWLEERWPELFAPGPDLQPLALDIHKEILKHRSECPALSRRTLDEALKRHMTSYGYLYGMSKHNYRVDLKRNNVEQVAGRHSAWASQLLRKKQKEAQRSQKGRKRLVKGNRGKPVVRKEKAPAAGTGLVRVRPATAAPVIRYKQRRKRVVTAITEVEMVS